jgi:hypothetical protein
VAAGLEAAMPAPSAGPNDVTTDAIGHADDDEEADESQTADGDPAFCDPIPQRVRARQRADALVLLAESFLAGTRADGTPRRARPRILVACELQDLVGEVTSRTARLLTAVHGANPAVTQEALRRLASDADLQFIITDHGQTVGVSAPTSTIPARVRAAVAARDQGCRFPGCRMPIQFTDCHHVKGREDDGPTIISNLVALCRRHHTAVTEGRWKLTMTPDGTVTVRRGRRKATSDPPERHPVPRAATATGPDQHHRTPTRLRTADRFGPTRLTPLTPHRPRTTARNARPAVEQTPLPEGWPSCSDRHERASRFVTNPCRRAPLRPVHERPDRIGRGVCLGAGRR